MITLTCTLVGPVLAAGPSWHVFNNTNDVSNVHNQSVRRVDAVPNASAYVSYHWLTLSLVLPLHSTACSPALRPRALSRSTHPLPPCACLFVSVQGERYMVKGGEARGGDGGRLADTA
jgi:hypothetical protein